MTSVHCIWSLSVFLCCVVCRGGFGLWLDADLYRGSSFSCPTFQNESLSTQVDFNVLDLEVWTVQNWRRNIWTDEPKEKPTNPSCKALWLQGVCVVLSLDLVQISSCPVTESCFGGSCAGLSLYGSWICAFKRQRGEIKSCCSGSCCTKLLPSQQ